MRKSAINSSVALKFCHRQAGGIARVFSPMLARVIDDYTDLRNDYADRKLPDNVEVGHILKWSKEIRSHHNTIQIAWGIIYSAEFGQCADVPLAALSGAMEQLKAADDRLIELIKRVNEDSKATFKDVEPAFKKVDAARMELDKLSLRLNPRPSDLLSPEAFSFLLALQELDAASVKNGYDDDQDRWFSRTEWIVNTARHYRKEARRDECIEELIKRAFILVKNPERPKYQITASGQEYCSTH